MAWAAPQKSIVLKAAGLLRAFLFAVAAFSVHVSGVSRRLSWTVRA